MRKATFEIMPSALNYNEVNLKNAVEKSNSVAYNLTTFIRFVRPYCSTHIISPKIFSIKLHNNSFGILIRQQEDHRFLITGNFNLECYTTALTNKMLLQFIVKHNLLNRI